MLGLTERLLSAAGTGFTVIAKVDVTPEYEAVSVTEVEVVTVPAVTEKVAEVAPCATVTEAGTLMAAFGVESDTDITAPPDGAAELRVTVPVPDWPLTIVLGLTERLWSAAATGFTVIPAVLLTLS